MTKVLQGWEYVPLADLVDVLDSQRIPVSARERARMPGSVPYYGATGRVGWIDKALFNEDLILLGEDGVQFLDPRKPKAYMISGLAWVNNHAHVLRARASIIDRRFLCYFLNHLDYRGYVNGTTRLKLTQAAMNSIPIPVPPLAEQHRIVASLEDHLSRLDKAERQVLDALHRISHFHEKITATVCIGKFGEFTPVSRAPFLEPAGVVDGELPKIPDQWRWARLGEIAEVVGGVTKDAKNQRAQGMEEVPYLRVANVQRGWLDLSEVTTIKVSPKKARQLELRPGDVLLNEGGDRDKLGRSWIWEGQILACIHQNHVFRARILDGILNPKLLAWHANSFGRRWFEMNGKQTVNLASISLSKIKLFPVPIPPREEQDRLVEAAEAHLAFLRKGEQAVRQACSRAKSLRQSLLAEAFAGRLVAQDPNDESASELLCGD